MDPCQHVTVLIVAYNGRDVLPACLRSILSAPAAEQPQRIVVVDNASSDGTAQLVRQQFPEVTLLQSSTNLGYAEGNNLGIEWIHCNSPGVPFVCLLNQDTLVQPGWLGPLVRFLAEHRNVAAAQPAIRLFPETELINSLGTTCHFLGFGFCTGLREAAADCPSDPRRVDAVSGAAVLLRTEAISSDGLFSSELRMYLEDVELSWRLRLKGRELAVVPESVVFHRYSGDALTRRYFYLERNRWILLLTYYRLRTLLLLAPALGLMEMGQWWFAARRQLLPQRIRVYGYLLDPRKLAGILRRRRLVQAMRQLDDAAWMSTFAGRIESPLLNGIAVRRLASPFFALYWKLARRLLLW